MALQLVTRSKVNNAGTTTKSFVSQEQSLEIMQTMIHGGLSNIFFIRQILPEHAYDQTAYGWSDGFHSYEDFATGKMPENAAESKEDSAGVTVLRRNRSKRADKFLDWLEHGAFEALRERNLTSLQVSVHPGPENREQVIETYKFTVKYTPNDDNRGQVFTGLEINGPGDHSITLERANATVLYLFRQLSRLCEGLPKLPEERYISMSLFYVNKKDANSHPDGFVPRPDGPFLFVGNKGWQTRAELLPDLEFGSQTAALQITYPQRKHIEFDDDVIQTADLPALPTPKRIKYTKTIEPFEDIKDIRTWHASKPKNATNKVALHIHDTRAQSDIAEDEGGKQEDDDDDEEEEAEFVVTQGADEIFTMPRSDEFPSNGGGSVTPQENEPASQLSFFSNLRGIGASELSETFNTQSSNFPAMKATRSMMQREQMTQGDTQAFSFSPVPPADAAAHPEETVNVNEKQGEETVSCQCKSKEEDDDMVQCVSCKAWQHLHCYGYTGSDDFRLAENHVCYQCLLGGKEDDRLETLRKLVVKRRGMHLAQQHNLTTQAAFVADMKSCVTTADGRLIYRYLIDEGYVIPSEAAGKGRKAHFVAVESGPKHDKMQKELFDPFDHISHHHDIPATYHTQRRAVAQQLQASQPGLMPPPITPSSRFNKAQPTSSRTDLDIRASVPAIETPSRPSSYQNPKLKRGREEDRGADSQTDFAFDGSWLRSSPATPSTVID